MKIYMPYVALVYVLVIIAASAGAITHGFDNGEHFFTVMGFLNLAFGGYGAYRIWRSENPKEK